MPRAIPATLVSTALAAAALAAAGPADAGPLLETYVLTAGGQSSYGVYGPPAEVKGFFSAGGVLIPTVGLEPAGVAGTTRLTSASTGSLSDSASVSAGGNGGNGPYHIDGTAVANAAFGKVGAEATATMTGGGGPATVAGAEAFGVFRDSFSVNPTSAGGPGGFVIFDFTVDGGLATSGFGRAGVEVDYRFGGDPVRTLLSASASSQFGTGVSAPGSPSTGGFIRSWDPAALTSSVAGGQVVSTVAAPVSWGTAFEFTLGLLAFVQPAKDTTVDAKFGTTALLTGIRVFDAGGHEVSDFAITSGSGTFYDADGVHPAVSAVPEPGSFALMGLGSLGLAFDAWRKKRRATALTA